MITLNGAPPAANPNPAAPGPVVPCPDGAPADAAAPSQDAAGKASADPRHAFARLLGHALKDPNAEASVARDAAKDAAEAEKDDDKSDAADPAANLLASAQLAPTLSVIPAEAKPLATTKGEGIDAARAPKGTAATLPAAADAKDKPVRASDAPRADAKGDSKPLAADEAKATDDAKPAREPKSAREISAARDAASTRDPAPVREAAPAPAPANAAAPTAMAAPAQVPAMQVQVAAPVQSAEFPREFAAQVQIAVQRGVEQASIQVNPPELGPIELRIEVSNGEARVHVAADAPATRDAIADAMPRLRELLGSQGLTLADQSVGAQLPQRDPQAGAGNAGAQGNGGRGDAPQGAAETLQPVAPATRVSVQRLLDVYA